MRVLCLVDEPVVPPDRWIWNYLSESAQLDSVDFMHVQAHDCFAKWGKLVTYYPSYVLLSLRTIRQVRLHEYDLIVAWEGKNGFALALMRSLMGMRRPRMIILTYSQRGVVAHFPWITRFALKSVNHLTVTSSWEKACYSTMLGVPGEHVAVCPLGWYDLLPAPGQGHAIEGEGFVFASGRSYRDYATFAAALEGTNYRAVVNARRFNLRGVRFPPGVVINDLLPREQFYDLLKQARFVVVPLQDVPHAAGDSHIVQTMAAGKAVIATRGPSSVTYVEDGVTGILVPPRDVARMREAMEYLWTDPEAASEMGARARERYEREYTFGAFAERVYGVLCEVAASA